MVDLDAIEQADEKLLHEMISRHYQYTNSTVARFILNDFENQLKNFVKVFPKDYKRVLSEKNTATNLPDIMQVTNPIAIGFHQEIKMKK